MEGDGFTEGAPSCTLQYSMSKRYFVEANRFAEGSLKHKFARCQTIEDATGRRRVHGRVSRKSVSVIRT